MSHLDPHPESPAPGEPWPAPRPPLPARARRVPRIALHASLFVLTVASTWLVNGFWYSLAIVAILLAHEMGHYLACRRYRVPATLPFFIPMPFTLFGTMGAVIRMRGRIPDRRVLFDIAVAGPLAGLVLAVPACLAGLKVSTIVPAVSGQPGTVQLGDSLLFSFLSRIVLGPLPEGMDVMLHPLAFAGWAGLFVTALNLLPVGQLDGGHVIYALLSRRSRWVSVVVVALFAYICIFHFPGWTLLLALIVLFGFRHPPVLDETRRLDPRRRALGIAMLLFFVVSFTPVPVRL